jgi:guanylate kinase
MEWGIKNHEFLEYGEHNGNLYGTKLDSVRAIIDEGRTCILDSSPQSLKLLRNSSEFMPFIIFLAAPGLDEMRHIYDNLRVTNSMIASSKNLVRTKNGLSP